MPSLTELIKEKAEEDIARVKGKPDYQIWFPSERRPGAYCHRDWTNAFAFQFDHLRPDDAQALVDGLFWDDMDVHFLDANILHFGIQTIRDDEYFQIMQWSDDADDYVPCVPPEITQWEGVTWEHASKNDWLVRVHKPKSRRRLYR